MKLLPQHVMSTFEPESSCLKMSDNEATPSENETETEAKESEKSEMEEAKSVATTPGADRGRKDEKLSVWAVVGPIKISSKIIGKGCFGELRLGKCRETGDHVAVKLEIYDSDESRNTLPIEENFYRRLQGVEGIPKLYFFGTFDKYLVLAMEFLGSDLEFLFGFCGNRFSIKTVGMIALRVINMLQAIHEKGIVFRDVKPDNIMIGRHKFGNHNKLYLVDFGLSKMYLDEETREHKPYRDRVNIAGTPRYMSINSHQGVDASRRDDFESLAYVLVMWLRGGTLPWSGLPCSNFLERLQSVGRIKAHLSPEQLTAGLPRQVLQFLTHARGLEYEEEPDYAWCRGLFVSLLARSGATDDAVFDWSGKVERCLGGKSVST